MSSWEPYLEWIDTQRDAMLERVSEWSSINTYSYHRAGLDRMLSAVREAVKPLKGTVQEHELKPYRHPDQSGRDATFELGRMLTVTRRAEAKRRILLGIHMDTVYPPDHPFQKVQRVGDNTLHGPGVADAKGGLVVLLTALEAFERSPFATETGWDLFVNSDEEIGSPGSTPYFIEQAPKFELGLLFEPANQGVMVNARKGSGNIAAIMRGRAAHAGRAFDKGRNAISALAELVMEVGRWHAPDEGVLVNVGRIHGGFADNMVPDLAVAHINIRVDTPELRTEISKRLQILADSFNQREGFSLEIHGSITRPPKILDDASRTLMEHITDCARIEGYDLAWQSVGGVSDGNTLAAAGLPNIDTLGPRGGDVHSADEHLDINSLTERARLTALLIMRLAAGELCWPTKNPKARRRDE